MLYYKPAISQKLSQRFDAMLSLHFPHLRQKRCKHGQLQVEDNAVEDLRFVTFESAENRTNGQAWNMCLGVNHFYVTEAGRVRRRQRPAAQVNTIV